MSENPKQETKVKTFQGLVEQLEDYWKRWGCLRSVSYNSEVGAGTFNPTTFFGSLKKERFAAYYLEPCRRPTDGRYGLNPNRLQQYFQFQVIIKPSPENCQMLYFDSIKQLGIDYNQNDLRFIEDNWKSPTLGASGVGWEVWINGMEVAQFTYFQQMGGIKLTDITVEITYGLERLALAIFGKDTVYDLPYGEIFDGETPAGKNADAEKSGRNKSTMTYGEMFLDFEKQFCDYNYNGMDANTLSKHFDDYKKLGEAQAEKGNYYVVYDCAIKCSHLFNLLDAGKHITVQQRTNLIGRTRDLAAKAAELYNASNDEDRNQS